MAQRELAEMGRSVVMDHRLLRTKEPEMDLSNVKRFGATGDGSTDDTAAINAAITYASANSRYVIYIPTGTYVISDTIDIPSYFEVFGDGPKTVLDASTFAGAVIEIDDSTGVHVHSLLIDATDRTPDSAAPASIYCRGGSRLRISNVQITGSGDGTNGKGSGDGIRVTSGATDITIVDCDIQGGFHNVFIGYASERVVIDGIHSTQPGVEHVCIEWGAGESNDHDNKDIVISNIVGDSAGQHGLYIGQSSGVSVANVVLRNTHSVGCRIMYSDNVSVQGFVSYTSGGDGVEVHQSSSNVHLSNLILHGAGGYGMDLIGDFITVSNIDIAGSSGTPIYLNSVADNISIRGGNIVCTTTYWLYGEADNVIIDALNVSNTGLIYWDGGANFTLSNCHIDVSTTRIYIFRILGGSNILIEGNTFKGFSSVVPRVDGAENVSFINNIFSDTDNPANILDYRGTSQYGIVTGNDFTNAACSGDAVIGADTRDVHVHDNIGYLARGEERIARKTVSYDDTSPVAIYTVEDGYAVVEAWVEITTTWDGEASLDVGDGDDPNGLMADGDITLSSTGYYGIEDDNRGEYLWDGTDSHRRTKTYSASDTIDATLSSDGTQGEAIVSVKVVRL